MNNRVEMRYIIFQSSLTSFLYTGHSLIIITTFESLIQQKWQSFAIQNPYSDPWLVISDLMAYDPR